MLGAYVFPAYVHRLASVTDEEDVRRVLEDAACVLVDGRRWVLLVVAVQAVLPRTSSAVDVAPARQGGRPGSFCAGWSRTCWASRPTP